MTSPLLPNPAQPLPVHVWQPLDGAPRDGTWVWAWEEGKVHPCIAHFVDYDFTDHPYPIKPAQKYTGWLDEYSNPVNPTVWMPIPASPFGA